MSFTITKISANNFSHFDGFKEMNFSNWEIVFNYTSNTLILQMLNGAPFPKIEVSASGVIIKNGTAGTPETFSTVAEIRARLLELNYNPLQSSSTTGAVDSVNGQTGEVILDANDVGAIPLSGTEVGSPITGDLEMPFDESFGLVYKDSSKRFGFEIADVPKIAYQDTDNDIDNKALLQVFALEISSNKTDFRGFGGLQDYTPNIGDLDYPQKIYVDTPKLQNVTSSATVTPVSTNDIVTITAQATGLTLANPTGTFKEGKALMIRIKDDGTARSITFGSNYRAIGVTLPTTTVINKTLYLGIIYNDVDDKWDVLGINQEA